MVRYAGIQLGPVYLDSQYLLIIAVTIALVVYQLLVLRAHDARQEMAGDVTGQGNGLAARHLRVEHDHADLHLFGNAGGLAGILVAPVLFVSIQMGSAIALKAFAATIIGGFGDVAGAIIGGLAIGVIETFGAAYISVPYKDGFAFLVLILFLIFRPPRHLWRTRGGEKHERAQR